MGRLCSNLPDRDYSMRVWSIVLRVLDGEDVDHYIRDLARDAGETPEDVALDVGMACEFAKALWTDDEFKEVFAGWNDDN